MGMGMGMGRGDTLLIPCIRAARAHLAPTLHTLACLAPPPSGGRDRLLDALR
eukprot:CAMPEP_0173297234 /NCGR_PEP_ID=MMETSP1143-20121109/15410_1 /TAXON_ID=483371 /ORGANISM="non described non described, Strain CCMP2298" /LENGTH=51 /DNA_ID=CAMNT_0014237189 /DNA_START=1 /DNA_END=153 /DNA_ORIENTATION=-